MTSGEYSNLGARGKNFQKLMLSEKKKRSDLGLHIFLPKSRCSLKKKKGLHFHLLSVFPIFVPKSRCSLKKKVFISICSHFSYFCTKIKVFSKKKRSSFPFALIFPIFVPKSRCSLKKKKKKVFTQHRPLNEHLQRIQNCMCCFRGGAPKKGGA